MIVVAAGKGVRLGGDRPKQYEEIAGVPMLLRALRPFVSHPEVARTVVALPAADAAAPPPWLQGLAGQGLAIVPGGLERSDSVFSALQALGDACSVVLVHDAARPFVGRPVIDHVIATARLGVGAVAAVPLADTLKETAADSARVVRTIPRDRLWRAQTPQGFPRALLAEAHARARADGRGGTDDAVMVEALGAEVRVVPDSTRNFKVTTADDLALARLLAEQG